MGARGAGSRPAASNRDVRWPGPAWYRAPRSLHPHDAGHERGEETLQQDGVDLLPAHVHLAPPFGHAVDDAPRGDLRQHGVDVRVVGLPIARAVAAQRVLGYFGADVAG